MRITFFYIAILLLLGMDVQAQNYVTVYADCNYGGTSQMLKEGRYALGQTRIGNNNLSSMRIPRGFKIILYNGYQPGEGTEKMTYTSETNCLSSSGWNNKANAVVVERTSAAVNNNNSNNNNNGNYSNNNLVTIFSECNFRGNSKFFREGRYSMNDLGIGDDQLSSVKVPSGWSITLYQDPNQRGNSTTYSSDNSCLPFGWNNKTSSITVQRGNYNNNNNNNNNNYNNNRVTLFSDCNLQGNRKSFNEGRFSMYDLGIGDDELSSLSVPSGWSVTLYQDPNQRGGSVTYTSTISCLPSGWNNKTSSIVVRRGYDNGNNNNYNNNNNNNAVTLFSDCNYRGTRKSFGEGRYSMYELGVGDDETSSIRVSNGWTVTIYQDPNQRGSSTNYSSDINCLPIPWNNKTSSIWVRRSY